MNSMNSDNTDIYWFTMPRGTWLRPLRIKYRLWGYNGIHPDKEGSLLHYISDVGHNTYLYSHGAFLWSLEKHLPDVALMIFHHGEVVWTSVYKFHDWSMGSGGCLTCWCPCITIGRIAEIVDRGSTSCGVSGALYGLMMCLMGCSCFYRTRLRGQYFLEEKPCADCCVHFCCEECALCQEYRHLQNQGLDMTIGWYGNVHRQRRLAAMQLPPAIMLMVEHKHYPYIYIANGVDL
ncbi:hypothetical protein ACLB2K_039317 [Fragaria x ananassa]